MWEHRERTLSMSPQWPKLSDVYVKTDFTVKKIHFYLCVRETDRQTRMETEREREREPMCVPVEVRSGLQISWCQSYK